MPLADKGNGTTLIDLDQLGPKSYEGRGIKGQNGKLLTEGEEQENNQWRLPQTLAASEGVQSKKRDNRLWPEVSFL